MTAPLAFLDTETTGLDPDRHEVWEVGLILCDEHGERSYSWQLPADLSRADPMALNIGRFHDRRKPDVQPDDDRFMLDDLLAGERRGDEFVDRVVPVAFMRRWAATFVDITRGAHLVGAVVSFDADRLWRLLRTNGECPMWHYHLIDVEALASGWLAARYLDQDWPAPDDTGDVYRPPWNSNELSEAVGVNPQDFDRHTALGDARWARAIYRAVMGGEAS